jgi:hypothetical protein
MECKEKKVEIFSDLVDDEEDSSNYINNENIKTSSNLSDLRKTSS